LLVEDDADLRGVLSEYLEINGFAVIGAGSGREFYRVIDQRDDIQVAIIDLGLPDQPGHVLADYARRNTRMSVIVITANDTMDNRIETYRTGADLFIGKPIDSRELLAAVTAMAERYRERNGAPLAPAAPAHAPTTEHAWVLDHARRQLAAPNGAAIPLSPQETLICELFYAAGSAHVERRAMLDRIYGRDDESAQRALDNLIRRLRQKIGELTGAPAPILTAYGIGHSFSEPLKRL
jgi:DNA-binding response OmpR family regulator